MAETQKTYKYIDTDLDSNLLLTNLKHNAQKYVKFKGWDESKSREFYSALSEFEKAIEEGRLSSDQSGDIIDSGGVLNNGAADWRDKNGNVLSQEQYDALGKRDKKKATRDFFANREVASYLGVIAKSLYTKKSAKDNKPDAEKPKFDFTKHGLWNKFVTNMAPGGTGDLEAWLDSDPFDAKTKKRATTNRAKLFSDYINQYMTNLTEDIDFSDTTFGTRENYLQKLQALQGELANGVTDIDYRLINQLGGNPEEYRAFFTTDKKYIPVQEGPEGGQAGTSSASTANDTETRTRLNNLDAQYRKAFTNAKFKHYKLSSAPTGVKYDTTASDKIKAYQNALNAANVSFSVDRLRSSNGREYINYLEQYGEMNPSAFKRVDVGNHAGWYYIPESLDQNNFSVLGYNPTTHSVGRIYYGSLGPQARQDYSNILRQIDSWNQQSGQPLFQEGGQMPTGYQQSPTSIMDIINSGGAAAMFDQAQRNLSAQTKSDPKNRQPWKEENNYSSNELTSNDYVRLGSIAADIAALVDPEPISAGVLGLSSDIANLYADLDEGQGFWNSMGNFAGNVGLSAIGLIPVIGDAAGSGTKVVKSLIKLAPKVNKILLGSGILAGLSNADEIIKSFSKIGKDGPENEMNMQDWRNIGTALQLILGGANAGRNIHASKKAKAAKAASETGHMDVRVKDSSTGKEKVLRFGGKKDVEALRSAKTPDEVNAVINSHPSMKGKYSVVTDTQTGHAWMTDQSKWYKPWSWRQKTSTDILTGGSVSPVYSAKKFRNNYTPSGGRDRYLGGMVKRTGSPDEFVKYDFNPNGTTRAERGRARYEELKKRHKGQGGTPTPPSTPPTPPAPRQKQQPGYNKGQGYSGPGQKPQKTPEYNKMQEKTLIDRARQYRQTMKSTVGKSHSQEWKELISRGNSPSYLKGMGIWKQGGRLIRKAEGGMFVMPPMQPLKLPTFDDYIKEHFGGNQYGIKIPEIKLNLPEFKSPFDTGRSQMQYKSTPNYGTGYTSSIDYNNKEYGTTDKVSLSQIQRSNAGLRSKTLYPVHSDEGYDFTDAQKNTDIARGKWQSNASNRTADFMNWVTNWRKENPNGTQSDMLAAYNNLIDQMYQYKREMATPEHSGANSYRHDDAVTAFNRTNRAVYGTANSYPSGVHGYSEKQEGWNGSTTAQRFIDITDDDVTDLNFNFADDTPDEFKNLFSGLVKDKTGRYYVNDRKLILPELKLPDFDPSNIRLTPAPAPGPSTVNPTGEEGGDNGDKGNGAAKPKVNIAGLIQEALPNALAIGRYLAARQHNKEQYEIAKQMPVMLYDPMEAHRWMFGDEQAVISGRRAAGRLNHLSSQSVTADGQQQQAAQMEGYMKGVDYITQSEMQDAARRIQTAEAEWQQERKNQESRYNTAMKNRQNLFEKRSNVLTALGLKKRADYESLNGLLGQFETAARAHNEELQSMRDAAEKASLQNDISANMEKYGIPVTAAEQQMMNDLLTGNRKLSSLSEDEKKSYERLSGAIQEEVTRRTFAAKGISYRPFTPQVTTPTTFSPDITETLVTADRQGGVIGGDSEKVTIQKLKGKLKRMEVYQRHLESRLNAYEREADRAQKSASQYIRGQKKKK